MKSPLGIIFLTIAIDLIGFGMVVPLLPLYAQQFGASGTQVAFLFASYSLMQFIFAPVWGRLSDRVGRRPILLLGLSGSVIFYALFGYASELPPATQAPLALALLFVARIGAGIAGATISTAQAVIADTTT